MVKNEMECGMFYIDDYSNKSKSNSSCLLRYCTWPSSNSSRFFGILSSIIFSQPAGRALLPRPIFLFFVIFVNCLTTSVRSKNFWNSFTLQMLAISPSKNLRLIHLKKRSFFRKNYLNFLSTVFLSLTRVFSNLFREPSSLLAKVKILFLSSEKFSSFSSISL
jgi:hypothetical protein